MFKTLIASSLLFTAALMPLSHAAEIEVQMLNKGAKGAMVFEPDFIQAEVGDTIKFIPTDKGHNAEAIKGMLPEGVEMFKSKINAEFTLTIAAEGVYGVKCLPHYGMGMVALIVAGSPVNLEEAKAVKHPPKTKAKFEELLAQVPAQ